VDAHYTKAIEEERDSFRNIPFTESSVYLFNSISRKLFAKKSGLFFSVFLS